MRIIVFGLGGGWAALGRAIADTLERQLGGRLLAGNPGRCVTVHARPSAL